ncbi:MAG: hypothetical protein ACK56I_04660, partial [bacterium]
MRPGRPVAGPMAVTTGPCPGRGGGSPERESEAGRQRGGAGAGGAGRRGDRCAGGRGGGGGAGASGPAGGGTDGGDDRPLPRSRRRQSGAR